MKDTHKTEFARKIFLAAASLIVLFFIIAPSINAADTPSNATNQSISATNQLSIAAKEKYSISGYVFKDVNRNGVWNDEDRGLEEWIVYIDKDNNFRRDSGEEFGNTNSTGFYTISNLEKGAAPYRVREELQAYWAQTSVPKSHYIQVDKDNSNVNYRYNFSNVESKIPPIDQDQVKWLFGIYAGGAVICFLLGLGMIIIGIRNFKWMAKETADGSEKGEKCDKRNAIKENLENIAWAVAGLIIIVLGNHFLSNLERLSGTAVAIDTYLGVDQLPMWALVLIVVILFAGLLGVGICRPEQMESGQMRRSIAGLLVFGFVAILVFSLYGKLPVENKEIVSQYIQLVGIIIGFYFGAKITSDATGLKAEIDRSKSTEANIKIGEPNLGDKTLQIPVQNLGENTVKVTRIDLEEVENFKGIHSEKPEKQYIEKGELVNIPLANLSETQIKQITENKYAIKIWISDGTFKEKEATPIKKDAAMNEGVTSPNDLSRMIDEAKSELLATMREVTTDYIKTEFKNTLMPLFIEYVKSVTPISNNSADEDKTVKKEPGMPTVDEVKSGKEAVENAKIEEPKPGNEKAGNA